MANVQSKRLASGRALMSGLILVALAQGCAAIAGLDALEVVETGDASPSADAAGAGGVDADASQDHAGGAGGVAGAAGASGSTGKGGASGAGGAAPSGGSSGSSGATPAGGSAGQGGAGGLGGTGGTGAQGGSAATGGTGAQGGTGATGGAPGCPVGYECAPSPGAVVDGSSLGWVASKGILALCPPNVVAQKYFDPSDLSAAPPASCSCGCDAPSGSTCGATVECFTNGCNGSSALGKPTLGNCSQLTAVGIGTNYACKATVPYASWSGSCAPKASSSIPPLTSSISACAVDLSTAIACAGGGACVPQALVPGANRCLIIQGLVPVCPSPYTKMSMSYGAYTDTRGCNATSCTCSLPSGSCACSSPDCGVMVFDSPACDQTPGLVPVDGSCKLVPTPMPLQGWGVELVGYAPNVTCAANGQATPTGGVIAGSPVTLCCMP